MSETQPQPPELETSVIQDAPPIEENPSLLDVMRELGEVRAEQRRIRELLEAPAREEAARKAAQLERIKHAGDIGHFSG